MNASQLVPVLISLLFGFILGWMIRGGSGTASPGLAPPPAEPPRVGEHPEVESLIREGRMIEAIKLYRQRKNSGLKEAKDAVDALQRQIMPK